MKYSTISFIFYILIFSSCANKEKNIWESNLLSVYGKDLENQPDTFWLPLSENDINCLIELLKSRNDFYVLAAARVMGSAKIENAELIEKIVDSLGKLLESKDFKIQRQIIQSLGMIGKPAINKLLKALKSDNPEILFKATYWLSNIESHEYYEKIMSKEELKIYNTYLSIINNSYESPRH